MKNLISRFLSFFLSALILFEVGISPVFAMEDLQKDSNDVVSVNPMASLSYLVADSEKSDSFKNVISDFKKLLGEERFNRLPSSKKLIQILKTLEKFPIFPDFYSTKKMNSKDLKTKKIIEINLFRAVDVVNGIIYETMKHQLSNELLERLKNHILNTSSQNDYVRYLRILHFLILSETFVFDFTELNSYLRSIDIKLDSIIMGTLVAQAGGQIFDSGTMKFGGDTMFPFYMITLRLQAIKKIFKEIGHIAKDIKKTREHIKIAKEKEFYNEYLIETLNVKLTYLMTLKLTNKLTEALRLSLDMIRRGMGAAISIMAIVSLFLQSAIVLTYTAIPMLGMNLMAMGLITSYLEQVKIKYACKKVPYQIEKLYYLIKNYWNKSKIHFDDIDGISLLKEDNYLEMEKLVIDSSKMLRESEINMTKLLSTLQNENMMEFFEDDFLEIQGLYYTHLNIHNRLMVKFLNMDLPENHFDSKLRQKYKEITETNLKISEINDTLTGLDLEGMKENKVYYLTGGSVEDFDKFVEQYHHLLDCPNTTYFEQFEDFFKKYTTVPVGKFRRNPSLAVIDYIFE